MGDLNYIYKASIDKYIRPFVYHAFDKMILKDYIYPRHPDQRKTIDKRYGLYIKAGNISQRLLDYLQSLSGVEILSSSKIQHDDIVKYMKNTKGEDEVKLNLFRRFFRLDNFSHLSKDDMVKIMKDFLEIDNKEEREKTSIYGSITLYAGHPYPEYLRTKQDELDDDLINELDYLIYNVKTQLYEYNHSNLNTGMMFFRFSELHEENYKAPLIIADSSHGLYRQGKYETREELSVYDIKPEGLDSIYRLLNNDSDFLELFFIPEWRSIIVREIISTMIESKTLPIVKKDILNIEIYNHLDGNLFKINAKAWKKFGPEYSLDIEIDNRLTSIGKFLNIN